MQNDIDAIIWSLKEAKKALANGDDRTAESFINVAIGDLEDPEVIGILLQPGRRVCYNTLAVADLERQELEDEANGAYGDPRRCKLHGEVTSSPDGAFDAPCSACEAEMHELDCEEREAEEKALVGPPAPWTSADEEQYQRERLDPTFFDDIPF